MTIKVAEAILSLRPASQFVVRENKYTGLEWIGPDTPPSEAEVLAEVARLGTVAVKDAIRAHANERIARRYPAPRPVLMALRAVQLFNVIGQANWSSEQQAQAVAIRDAAEWMYQMDRTSSQLEQTMPADYTSDSYWPPAP